MGSQTSCLKEIKMFTEFMNNHVVGLNVLFDDLKTMQGNAEKGNFPPHRITNYKNEKYYLEFAVAGYTKEELKIELTESDNLQISSNGADEVYKTLVDIGDILNVTTDTSSGDWECTYDGIASRAFKKEFKLSPFMEVNEVKYDNGILTIIIHKKVVDEKESKTFEIN
jgi:HSP20 family molecular chaperone IbpA